MELNAAAVFKTQRDWFGVGGKMMDWDRKGTFAAFGVCMVGVAVLSTAFGSIGLLIGGLTAIVGVVSLVSAYAQQV